MAAVHQHLHGAPFDYLGVMAAALVNWLGVPGPGEPVLGAAGVWASRGKLDVIELLILAWIAATVGGTAGWLLGQKGGRPVWTARGPFQPARLRALVRGERIFDRYGLVAIYFAPSWVAGIHGVPARYFLPANAFCAAIWTLLVGLGAYLLGPAVTDVIGELGSIGGVALGLLLLAGVVVAVLHRHR